MVHGKIIFQKTTHFEELLAFYCSKKQTKCQFHLPLSRIETRVTLIKLTSAVSLYKD